MPTEGDVFISFLILHGGWRQLTNVSYHFVETKSNIKHGGCQKTADDFNGKQTICCSSGLSSWDVES